MKTSYIIIAAVLVAIVVVASLVAYYYYVFTPTTPKPASNVFKMVFMTDTPGSTTWDSCWLTALDSAVNYFKSSGVTVSVSDVFMLTPSDYKRVCASYIDQGYDLIFGCEAGYQTLTLELADQYPNMHFLTQYGAPAPWNSSQMRPNLMYFAWEIWKGYYTAGIIAGSVTKSNIIGWTSAFDYPANSLIYNMMMAGAKSVNPNVVGKFAFTGSWSDPVAGAAAGDSLVALGADVLVPCGGAIPPAVIKEVASKGIPCIGYIGDEHSEGPDNVLTSVVYNGTMYIQSAISDMLNGKFGGGVYSGSPTQVTSLAPYYNLESAIPQSTRDKVQEVLSGLAAGTFTLPNVPTTMPTS